MTVNIHAILVGLLSVSHTPEQADHAARSVLEQHAHELAERQRKVHDEQRPYFHGGQPCKPWWDCSVRKVIDSIDPQARPEGDGGEQR